MPETKVRVALVGGGQVGVGFSKKLAKIEWVDVCGIQTRSPARQKELEAQFGYPAFGTVREMIEATKPDVVAVVNANADHRDAAIEALEAGAHVYLEKPMAPTLAECEEIVAAEARTGRIVQVGFEYMHGTMTSRLHDLVREGYFGEVTWISVLDSRGHWASMSPSTPISEIWKLDRKQGGGIIFHCGIHQLDMIRTLLGPITEVSAFCPPKNALSFYPADVPDNVTLMLRAASGAVANFQVFHNRAPCYYRENFNPDWRTVPGHEFTLSLVGTAGSCRMDIYAETLSLFRFDLENRDTVFDRTEVFSPNHPDKSHHDMDGFLTAFLRNIAGGKGALVPSADHLETMRIACAAEDAIAGRTTTRIEAYR